MNKIQIVQNLYISDLVKFYSIKPSKFSTFPEGVKAADFTDPINLDELKEGEVYGFLVEDKKWYIAGSLKNINAMILSKFRGSSTEKVFVPFKNVLVPVKKYNGFVYIKNEKKLEKIEIR